MEQMELTDGGQVVILPDTSRKSVQTQEIMAVKHNLPRTKISNVLLHENVSQKNLLRNKLAVMKVRRQQTKLMYEHVSRSFIADQKRKERKWKQLDESRLASINLPHMTITAAQSVDSVLYRSPEYRLQSPPDRRGDVHGPLLPEINILPPTTHIVRTGLNGAFVQKVPEKVQRSEDEEARYDNYCGTLFMRREVTLTDDRFKSLTDLLSPPGKQLSKREKSIFSFDSDSDVEKEEDQRPRTYSSRRPSSRVISVRRSPKKRVTITQKAYDECLKRGVEARTEEREGHLQDVGSRSKLSSRGQSRGSVRFATVGKGLGDNTVEVTGPSLTMATVMKEHTLPTINLRPVESDASLRNIKTTEGVPRHEVIPVIRKSSEVMNDFKYKGVRTLKKLYGVRTPRHGAPHTPVSGTPGGVSTRAKLTSQQGHTAGRLAVSQQVPRTAVDSQFE